MWVDVLCISIIPSQTLIHYICLFLSIVKICLSNLFLETVNHSSLLSYHDFVALKEIFSSLSLSVLFSLDKLLPARAHVSLFGIIHSLTHYY